MSSLHVRLTLIVSPVCFSTLVTDLYARPEEFFHSDSCVRLFRSVLVHRYTARYRGISCDNLCIPCKVTRHLYEVIS